MTSTSPAAPWSLSFRTPGDPFVGHRQGHIVREDITVSLELRDAIRPFYGDDGATAVRVSVSDIPDHLVRKDGTLAFGNRILGTLREILEQSFGEGSVGYLEPGDYSCYLPRSDTPGTWHFETWTNRWLDLRTPAASFRLPRFAAIRAMPLSM